VSTLVAGFGNIFRSDDGLGCAVIRMLQASELGPNVRVRDFGTGGIHLALEMLAGYDAVIIVDAVSRDDPPGTVFAIEVDDGAATRHIDKDDAKTNLDAHDMTIDALLAVYGRLSRQADVTRRPKIVVAGCVPQNLEDGMDLSEPVRAALPACAGLVRSLTHQFAATGARS
jgi:hydrogenase maturation protease